MSGILGVAGLSSPYSYFAQPISGKLEVPVEPSQSLYAQFQFVRGIPSQDGGLSLDRVQIIDSLLSQINAHRQSGTQPVRVHPSELAHPDETILKLSNQAFEMQNAPLPYKAWGHVGGLVVNLKA